MPGFLTLLSLNSLGQSPQVWTTTANQTTLLQKVSNAPSSQASVTITVDPAKTFQTIDGFGYTLSGGSAQLINQLNPATKKALLQELFGNQGIKISYLRISVAASDLHDHSFTYDEVEKGASDPELKNFTLKEDDAHGTGLIPLLKEIKAIQPGIKIMASPWTAPIWMKSNQSYVGGSLLPQYYETYARYLVKYILAMKAKGINIDALTPQNEPQHGGNDPSMVVSAEESAAFIRDHLGPAFRKNGIKTKIIVWDHNCDNPQYPITILNDQKARQYIDGSAFHLYNGTPDALSVVKKAHPDKNLYFTEQWTGSKGTFDGDLQWHVKNVIIGTLRNYSKIALEWNLANDPQFNPHTPGGCTECKGALTINKNDVQRNVSYYIVSHASKFIPAGSKRIYRSEAENISTVACVTPPGKTVLIVLNENKANTTIRVSGKGKTFTVSLNANSVSTIVW